MEVMTGRLPRRADGAGPAPGEPAASQDTPAGEPRPAAAEAARLRPPRVQHAETRQAADSADREEQAGQAQARDAGIGAGQQVDGAAAHARPAAGLPGPDQPAAAQPAAAGGAGDDGPGAPAGLTAAAAHVPRLLQQAAAWSWRLILVAIVIYFAFRVVVALRLVVLPLIAATLLTALLQPVTGRLRRVGMPRLAATWCTLLAAIIVLAGLGTLTANRVSAEYPQLTNEVKHTAAQVQHSLAGPPFHLSSARLQRYSDQFVNFLSQHKGDVAGTVLTGGRIFLEFATGLVLTAFITFFLLKDGDRIWSFVLSGLRPQARQRADKASAVGWQTLVNYIRGTTLIAAIHAVFIGVALWALGVPLLFPLVILVFLAAFIPLVGILVVGALAVLVTLGTKGWIAAVILIAVFLVENQIESHLLQPLVVGRLVRLHPLAIILVLAVGGIVAGVPGAIVAVPTAAVIFYAWPYLRGAHERAPPEQDHPQR
jgi:predicted PurR-regulated permease PerM